jgi:hypothetical protein
MYRRIFADISRFLRVGSFICGTIVLLWALAFVPTAIFQCTPVSKAWDIDKPGRCISLRVGFFCVALPNILTDVAILSLPIQVCWQSHTKILYRISFAAIFMLGGLWVILLFPSYTFDWYRMMGCWHINAVLLVLASIDSPRYSHTHRTMSLVSVWNARGMCKSTLQLIISSGTIGPATLWSVIECAVAIICACLPLLVPIVRRVSRWLGIPYVSDADQHHLGSV